MGDTDALKPDHEALFAIAAEQHGYFTAQQARNAGFRSDLVAWHTRRGRFIHIRRGLYRLRDYPPSPNDFAVEAWMAVGKDRSVVSHESALDLLDLSDVIPAKVHLSVPRSRRNLPKLPGVRVHTTKRDMGFGDVVTRDGIRVTSPVRTILDSAQYGAAPEQIEMAIQQALDRGLVQRDELLRRAGTYDTRVRQLVGLALARVEP